MRSISTVNLLRRAVQLALDDLFDRKEFGEKWARHWLDVARYADSNGSDFNLTYQRGVAVSKLCDSMH